MIESTSSQTLVFADIEARPAPPPAEPIPPAAAVPPRSQRSGRSLGLLLAVSLLSAGLASGGTAAFALSLVPTRIASSTAVAAPAGVTVSTAATAPADA